MKKEMYEIKIDGGGLLILTKKEYYKALFRGAVTLLNRKKYKEKNKK